MQRYAEQVLEQVRKAVVGKDEILVKVLMAILAGGHILLEDIPGVGKTTLALAFSRAMQLKCSRMQFTPDVLPSDVTGYSVYGKDGRLLYQPGAVLCNLFLADEINRTSSKTQSALLEVMEEGAVTVDGVRHAVPQPFTVIATQNPVGSAGTQLLPESQLDRFMVRLSMGYPAQADEVEILDRRRAGNPLDRVEPVVDARMLLQMREEVEAVYADRDVLSYIVRLSEATRQHKLFKLGVSPRVSLAMAKLARACAWLSGRDYLVPADVRTVFLDVAGHRVLLSPQAKLSGRSASDLLQEIVKETPAPALERKRK